MRQVLDSRRRLAKDVLHLGGMVVTEKIAPKLLGSHRVAKHMADRGDDQMIEAGAKLRLLNQAPRRRLETMEHEAAWRYDLVRPGVHLHREVRGDFQGHRVGSRPS